ncbi:MAG: hypothetical protein EOM87_06450 [Clostridia bacterium]|nr:hypothetical protein [Clostridia bacterium]
MKKRLVLKTTLIIALLAVMVGLSVYSTYAIWTTMPAASVVFEMGVVNENASLKYQLFVPINADNERIDGSYNFTTKEYTLTNPADSVNVIGLALVGMEAGITVDFLQIPDIHDFSIDGVISTLPVKAVIIDTEYRNYYLRGNSVLIRIIIPQNVNYIGSGAFVSMTNLTTLIIHGTGDILLGEYSFADCRKLTTPQTPDGRTITGTKYLG